MTFDETVAAMCAIRWGSAPAWDGRAHTWLLAYYQRLGAWWPAARAPMSPAAAPITLRVQAMLSTASAARVEAADATIRAATEARDDELEATTRDLIPLVLAWSLAVEAGAIAVEASPGVPLLSLFGAGFQLQYRHEGIHIHYEGGWRIYQPPTSVPIG